MPDRERGATARVSVAGYYSGLRTDAAYTTDTDGGLVGFGFPGSTNAVNRRIADVTGTVSFLAVQTTTRGSVQVNAQTSWLRREPWSVGTGPPAAEALLFYVQARYNLP